MGLDSRCRVPLEIADLQALADCIIRTGVNRRMQPARLGARPWYFGAATLLGILVLASPSRAQAVLETPQQTNDRIKQLSAAAAIPGHDYEIWRGHVLSLEGVCGQ